MQRVVCVSECGCGAGVTAEVRELVGKVRINTRRTQGSVLESQETKAPACGQGEEVAEAFRTKGR